MGIYLLADEMGDDSIFPAGFRSYHIIIKQSGQPFSKALINKASVM